MGQSGFGDNLHYRVQPLPDGQRAVRAGVRPLWSSPARPPRRIIERRKLVVGRNIWRVVYRIKEQVGGDL